jgi:ABC-type antimicrobial peptide transport system permease subunit
MAAGRPILALTSIILLAGGITMTFFIVLSGMHDYHTPLNKTYFLQSTTTGITGANSQLHNPTRWTYLSVCGVVNGDTANCGHTHAAQSFDPVRNFGTTSGVPGDFVSHQNFWWYMSRFAWVFYLIALFFAVLALLISALALCTRLGSYLTGFMTWIALFCQTVCAALMTAWVVKARNDWNHAGQTAKIGEYAMGFTWGTWAAYFIAGVLFCVGGAVGKRDGNYGNKTSYFGRKRSTRSRGSFIDNESQRRVKDEYE